MRDFFVTVLAILMALFRGLLTAIVILLIISSVMFAIASPIILIVYLITQS